MNDLPRGLSRAFPLFDAALLVAAGWLAFALRWGHATPSPPYALAMALGGLFALVFLPATGAYRSWRGRDHSLEVGNALPGLAVTFVALMAVGTFSKTTADFSRLWMAYWVLAAGVFAAVARGGVRALLRRRPPRVPRIVIVGSDALAVATAERLRDHYGDPAVVAGFVHTGAPPDPGTLPAPLLGGPEALDTVLAASAGPVDEVWLASSHLPRRTREALVVRLQESCHTIRFVPDLSLLDLLGHLPAEVAGMTVIELNASPLDGPGALLKAALDRLGALAGLLLLGPLMLLIALAIRVDSPGPVLFRQRRHGGLGNAIEVYKFRTMHHDDDAAYRQATRDDRRVTRVGAMLRRSSLDELPQLLNVLRGEMSLVGPRPHPVALNHEFTGKIDAYMQRHRVKPGITGWAQVHGLRGETDTLEKMERRVAYDLHYIENWSLWLDIRILCLTLIRAWTDRNAY